MRNITCSIADTRKRVFAEVAKMAYDEDYSRMEKLPYEIMPGEKATVRESIFLERAIVGERIRLAMGLPLRSVSEHNLLSDGVEESAIAEKYYDPPLINIIKYACNACPPTHYEVSNMCQGCLAHHCYHACPKNAISFVKGKAVIDQEKCIKCGRCKQSCSYQAIIKFFRPCQEACGMDAIVSDEHGRAKIDQDKCVACGRCVEVCPAGAAKLGQKLCSKKAGGRVPEYPRQELPDATKWDHTKWSPNYRNDNRIETHESGTAPCKTACPAHVAVQGYLKLAAQGRYDEALALIKRENPLPAICGRVCNRRCEDACTRGSVDAPIAIDDIKKFIASAGTYANLVRQAKSRQKILDKMEADGLIQPVVPDKVFTFRFPEVEKLPPPVLAFDDMSFSYSGKPEDNLYEHLDIGIDMDSRVALVGPNGVGKSTLLKLFQGKLQPQTGRVIQHTHIKLGVYSQHSADQLDLTKSPLEFVRDKFANISQDYQYWRGQLGRYGLSGEAQTAQMATLSEGQRSRVVFALLALEGPNLILLDEPTNGLDLGTIDSLADAINAFNGGVVVVSHDFRLLDKVAKDIFVIENKTATRWNGSILDYKKSLASKVVL